VFTFSNKQLHVRVLAHDEDESRIDKYRVEYVGLRAALYAAAAAKNLLEKSQSRAERSG